MGRDTLWLQGDPAMTHASDATTASASLRQDALTAVANGRFAEAVASLTSLVRLIADDDTLWAALAAAHFGAGDIDRAITAAERAIEVMPVNVEAWSHLADAYAAAGLWEEALGAAQQQFELKPFLPDGLYKSAVAFVHLDEPEGAIRALEAALSQRRSLKGTLAADARFAALQDHPGFRQLLD
jgi:tetratricopeptide (TPR) repeat protein